MSRVPSARLTPDWEPYKEDQRYMKIGSGRLPDISMEKDFLPVRMGFWEYLMGNVSQPLDKLFLRDNDNKPAELERATEGSASIASPSMMSNQEICLLIFVIYALLTRL